MLAVFQVWEIRYAGLQRTLLGIKNLNQDDLKILKAWCGDDLKPPGEGLIDRR
jgi:hypothetical protein